MASKIFQKARKNIPENSKVFVANSFDIIKKIRRIMRRKRVSQKDLASKLNKTESEVSKILSPGHNITLKTISKIQVALGEKIIYTEKPLKNKIEVKVVYADSERHSLKNPFRGINNWKKERAIC